MARKLLNKEEIAELEQNPGVEKATANTVSFTAEFKRIAYEQLAGGRTLRDHDDDSRANFNS